MVNKQQIHDHLNPFGENMTPMKKNTFLMFTQSE